MSYCFYTEFVKLLVFFMHPMTQGIQYMLALLEHRVDILPIPELLTMASCRKDWKRISADSSVMSSDDPVSQGTELN